MEHEARDTAPPASVEALEAEYQRLRAELATRTREYQDLLFVTSHDLRSPLVSILGFSSRLEKACHALAELMLRAEVPEALRREVEPYLRERIPSSLGYIKEGAFNLERQLDGLLLLSRSARGELPREKPELDDLVRKVLSRMGAR
jgi:signal transduction histidine kinase